MSYCHSDIIIGQGLSLEMEASDLQISHSAFISISLSFKLSLSHFTCRHERYLKVTQLSSILDFLFRCASRKKNNLKYCLKTDAWQLHLSKQLMFTKYHWFHCLPKSECVSFLTDTLSIGTFNVSVY